MEWYGKLPENWETIRIKTICSEIIKLTEKNEGNLLSVSQYTGVTEKKDNIQKIGMHEAESLIGYKIVEKNDLVMNIMLAWNGSLGVSNFDGIVSPAYSVFRFNENVNPWYFHYLFRSPEIKNYFKAHSTGVVESRLRLYPNIFGSLYTPFPPCSIQSKIVQYLDNKVSKINKLIEAQKKKMILLKEYKREMINWEISTKNKELREEQKTKLKKILQLEYGKALSDEKRSINGKYPVYGANGIVERTDTYYFDKPSLIIGRKGSAGEIQKCVEKFWPLDVTYYTVFDENKYDIDYLFYLLLTLNLQNLSKGIKPGLNRNDVYEIEVSIPNLSEQQSIVNRIDERCEKIYRLILNIERHIELLGEYKTRFISDVVTGKIDIHNVALQENKTEKQHIKIIEFTPQQRKDRDEAVIITALVSYFGTEEHPFTTFDIQKFTYLLHRHIEGVAENYGKFAAGPYNSRLKYEVLPIALEMKYIQEHTGRYKGFVADENAPEAVKYFKEWYGNQPLEWMLEQFRYVKDRKNELKLLTTVDYAMVELHSNGLSVTMQTVKNLINASPVWRDKLTSPIFSDENIERAIQWSYKLFGNNSL